MLAQRSEMLKKKEREIAEFQYKKEVDARRMQHKVYPILIGPALGGGIKLKVLVAAIF